MEFDQKLSEGDYVEIRMGPLAGIRGYPLYRGKSGDENWHMLLPSHPGVHIVIGSDKLNLISAPKRLRAIVDACTNN